jgi:hypothetical protein
MQIAMRSYLTAGVALVGATAMVVAPISVTPPEIQVPRIAAASVELAAFQDPIALWAEVLGTAGNSLAGLKDQLFQDPAPMLMQLLANQIHGANIAAGATQSLVQQLAAALSPNNPDGVPAQLKNALDQVAAGNITQGLMTVMGTLIMGVGMPIIIGVMTVWPAVAQPFQNLSNLVTGLPMPLLLGLGLSIINPVNSVLGAAGDTVEALIKAATTLDPVTFASTLINAPAVLTGALLNGYVANGYPYPGLLTPGVGNGGTIAAAMTTFSQLADLMATPGADRHDIAGSLATLGNILTGGLLGGQASARIPTEKVAATDIAALPDPTALSIDLPNTHILKAPKLEKVDLTPTASAKATPVTEVAAETPAPTDTPAPTNAGTEAGTPSTGTPSTGSTEATAGTIVRHSPRATPGKPGTTAKTNELKKVAQSVTAGLNDTAAKIGDGLKKLSKPAKAKVGADSGSSSE